MDNEQQCECAGCVRLKQALLSFTGILRRSEDDDVRKAAHTLYKNVKYVKIDDRNLTGNK